MGATDFDRVVSPLDFLMYFHESISSDYQSHILRLSRKVFMATTPTPHDSFFKDVFGPGTSHLPALFSLLDAPFASRIDFSSLTYLSGETIGEGLSTSFRSDLVGSLLVADATVDGAPLEFVFLFEHKSSSARHIHLKLACLVTALWARFLREEKTPPPIVPILFYHGERPWTLPSRLSEVLGLRPELASGMPDYELLLIDLSRFDDRELRRRVSAPEVRAHLATMKHIHDPLPTLLGVVGEFLKEIPNDRGIMLHTMITILDYISHVHPEVAPPEMLSLLTTFTQEEEMTTVVDYLRDQGIEKGLQQGIEKGLQQGIEKGRQQDIERLLSKGVLSPGVIASTLEVDLSWVEEIARQVRGHK